MQNAKGTVNTLLTPGFGSSGCGKRQDDAGQQRYAASCAVYSWLSLGDEEND